ncbi:MAG: acetyl-CoA carboxylase biotin carboxyl carrier protein [Candidatus Eisenbacteria bacterium]|nr:acetyl-CoA carboxylase biotin carboxyl carrier protein [Candidatus Eisenbacteria bacterium]
MDKKRIEELIRLVEESDIRELHVRSLLDSVRIVKGTGQPENQAVPGYEPAVRAPVGQPPQEETPIENAEDRDSGLVPITSPMVGTFYAAPSPESPPYIRQGDHISKGQIVCIVEAMKLINEIESDITGTIVRVAVENAQPVEFGQTLFMVEPD